MIDLPFETPPPALKLVKGVEITHKLLWFFWKRWQSFVLKIV